MPQYLSQEAQSLLRCLFKRNPVNRLGSGPGAGQEIKEHAFFASVDFEKLANREITPPYIPAVAASDNLFAFEQKSYPKSNEHVTKPGDQCTDSPGVPASATAHELFRGFSFVAPVLLEEEMHVDENVDGNSRTRTQNSVESPMRISQVKGRSLADYEFMEELGKGSFSVVKRCVHKESNTHYAVKIIDKAKRDTAEEVEILLRFSSHPNIATLHDLFDDGVQVYLFFDLLEGGELLDRIVAMKSFSEQEASDVLCVLARTLKYLHENGVSCFDFTDCEQATHE